MYAGHGHMSSHLRAEQAQTPQAGQTNSCGQRKRSRLGLASLFAAEPVQKFVPVAKVVFTRLGRCDMLGIHPVVPAMLELKGYPLFVCTI